MGLGEENEPPKKKLKQAQLCFTPKSQKRKLVSDLDDDVQIVKIICKGGGTVCDKLNCQDKENKISVTIPATVEEKCNLVSLEHTLKTTNTSEICDKEFIDKPSLELKKEVKDIINEADPNSSCQDQDFSLSMSDSVLDTLCRKSPSEDEIALSDSADIACIEADKQVENASDEKEDSLHDSCSKVLTPSDLNDDDACAVVISDDEGLDISSSADGSPDKKTSPTTPSNTPSRKVARKRIPSTKKKEERERIRQEKKAERDKLKAEKIKQLEEEKRKKKEEKEKKREMDQRLKEEERMAKEEEKKKKEEERKQKEEEKKKKEEERRKREEVKEEEKRKKEEIEEKKKAAFAKFFKKKSDITEKSDEHECQENRFMPFPMKPDMKLANEPRRLLSSEEKDCLEKHLTESVEAAEYSYIKELKSGKHIPLKSEATWPLSAIEEEHDVIIIESTENGDCVDLTEKNVVKELKKKTRAKLLQFHDNRRPPYWGTWRKRSKCIGPRKPLGQDKVIFDYEVDSDSEWEDEVDGEDIEKEDGADSDGEQSEEEETANENGYVLDNTFVPHGYLSDEEVQPDEDIEDNDPENLKIRMKLLKQEFDEEMKTKTERLKPRLLGCVWISNITTEVSSGSLYEGLMTYRAIWDEEEGPIDVMGPIVEDSPTATPTNKKIFPPTVLPLLITFVHESNLPMSSLVREFITFMEREHPSENVSKRAVTLKIKEIATKTYDYSTGKPTWSVNQTMCEEYGLKPYVPNMPCPAPIPPVLPVVEKTKEGPMMNFLKNAQTPPLAKKKIPFVTLTKSQSYDYTPSKLNETGGVKDFGTPRPMDPVLKKRALLITLSKTVDKPFSEQSPVNSSTSTLSSVKQMETSDQLECINLCDNSL